jgi:hypothetical protein
MTPDSKTAAAKTRPALAAVATLCALVLVACNAQAEAPAPENSASTATGVLETSAGIYEFTPVSCGIHEEDGVYDILIAGSGKAPDGEAFYLDLSPTEMSIDLGVDVPFKASDRQIRAGHYVSQPFALDVSDRIVSVSSLALVDERGQSIDANARMRIDCGA